MNLSVRVLVSTSLMVSIGHKKTIDAMVSFGHIVSYGLISSGPMTKRKPMQLRLPDEVKDWLESQATINGSSQNSEVIRAIRDRMAATETNT